MSGMPMSQTSPQRPPDYAKDYYQQTRPTAPSAAPGMPGMPSMPTLSAPPGASKAAPPSTTVPIQLAKDFLNIVKNGNITEIVNFISMLPLSTSLDQYNLDVTKIVDDNYRHTCLFYAVLIKDPERYSLLPEKPIVAPTKSSRCSSTRAFSPPTPMC